MRLLVVRLVLSILLVGLLGVRKARAVYLPNERLLLVVRLLIVHLVLSILRMTLLAIFKARPRAVYLLSERLLSERLLIVHLIVHLLKVHLVLSMLLVALLGLRKTRRRAVYLLFLVPIQQLARTQRREKPGRTRAPTPCHLQRRAPARSDAYQRQRQQRHHPAAPVGHHGAPRPLHR